MQLTRRDAIAALAAAGVAAGGAGAVLLSVEEGDPSPGDEGAPPVTADRLSTLVAAAEVLYPTEVEDIEAFVERYVRGRAADRPDVADGMTRAVDYLDDYSEAWYEDSFAALTPSTRDEALRKMNADTGAPDPSGSAVERVRHYVVDELLFALYASPTGGRLVGIENPRGHPGGLDSYQRGPDS